MFRINAESPSTRNNFNILLRVQKWKKMQTCFLFFPKINSAWHGNCEKISIWNTHRYNSSNLYRYFPHCKLFLDVTKALYDVSATLHWRHNGRDSVSNHQPQGCLLNRLLRRRSKKTSSSASLAFVRGIHRGPVNSPHKGPVTQKMFPFDDVIMK